MTIGNEQQPTAPLIARAEMLIRRPVAEVFQAFIDPAITTKFWFTRSSGRLAPGARVRWDWEMFNASAQVTVREIEQDRRIVIAWGDDESTTTVAWLFTPRADGTTFVSVTNAGFQGDEGAIIRQVIDATEGFTLLLAGLKAFLEHRIQLNLVADRFPTPTEVRSEK